MATCSHGLPTESAAQVFARLGAREPLGDLGLPFLSPLNGGDGVKAGDTVEVWGEEGSGKSELLLNIAVQCAIPKNWKGILLGGCGLQCLLISTDYKVDLLRLEGIAEGQLRQRIEQTGIGSASHDQDGIRQLLTESLTRIHIFYTDSSDQLTAILHSLRQFIHIHSEVSIILLDNAGAYYWIDRAEAAYRRNSPGSNWMKVLKELIADLHLVLFAARPVLFSKRTEQVGTDSYLGPFWKHMIKHSFNVQRRDAGSTGRRRQGQWCDENLFEIRRAMPTGPVFTFIVTETGVKFIESPA